jgi:hypothetical protein
MPVNLNPNHGAVAYETGVSAESSEHNVGRGEGNNTQNTVSGSSQQEPADASSVLRDQYEPIPGGSQSSTNKRPLEDGTEGGPSKKPKTVADPSKNGLAAVGQLQDKSSFYGALGVPDTASLNRVSKQWNASVQSESVLPQLHGRRTVSDPNNPEQKQDLWSKEPASEPKRYFKPASGAGQTADVPHISEQQGFGSHLTDVGSMRFNAHSKMAAGEYPAKLQFPVNGGTLGTVDAPSDPRKGRVLTPAPPQANEKPGTYIETKSHSRAERGPLTDGYPRTQLTPEQANQPAADVEAKWEGKQVTGKERT